MPSNHLSTASRLVCAAANLALYSFTKSTTTGLPRLLMRVSCFITARSLSFCCTGALFGSRHSPSQRPLAIWKPPESPSIRVFGSRLRTMSSDISGLVRSRFACPPEYNDHLYGNNAFCALSQFIISISDIPNGIRAGST